MQQEREHIYPHIITYKQLCEDDYELEDDKYDIAKFVVTESAIKMLTNNPIISEDDKTVLYFKIVDGIIGGRVLIFGTRLKLDNQILVCGSGSSLKVAEPFRHLGLGADIMTYMTFNSGYDIIIAAGISKIALPLYKVLKYSIFEFPQLTCFYNSRSLLEHYGIHGCFLKFLLSLANIPFRLFKIMQIRKSRILQEQFELKREDLVPEWIDAIVLKDGHKYCEVHDHKWFQWNLDNQLTLHNQYKSSFFCIYKEGRPLGFFFTKEKWQGAIGSLQNVLKGFISEWGSVNEKLLSELDIYILALSTFSNKVELIYVGTPCESTLKGLKKMGFINNGTCNIAVKGNKKKYNDFGNIKQWRIRSGYGDTMLY